MRSTVSFHTAALAQNVRELAAWLLSDVPGWTHSDLDAAIAKEADWRSSCRDECQWLGSTSPAGRRMMAKCSSGMTSMILITARPHLSEANCDLLTSPVHIWMHDERGGLITATSRATNAQLLRTRLPSRAERDRFWPRTRTSRLARTWA